jgi:sugar phosphate isomerase/epimerase
MSSDSPLRIGNQTAASAANFLEPFEYALASDFDAFEWFPDKKLWGAGWDEADLPPARCAEVRSVAQARGVRLSVHARWTANPLKAEAHPILLRDIQLAESLGAALVNIHLYPGEGIPAYAKALEPFLRNTRARGLQLSIENTVETTPQHFNELFRFLRPSTADSPSPVGLCLDLGHANLCAATRNDYLRFMDELDPHVPIIHLHVHENWGDADSHLPLFTGPSAQDIRGIEGFIQRLRARRYTGSLILEQWPQPPSLLNAARQRLLDLFAKLPSPALPR